MGGLWHCFYHITAFSETNPRQARMLPLFFKRNLESQRGGDQPCGGRGTMDGNGAMDGMSTVKFRAFHKWGYPQMVGLQWKIPVKWMEQKPE